MAPSVATARRLRALATCVACLAPHGVRAQGEIAAAPPASGPGCSRTLTRVAPAALSGRRIGSLEVTSGHPLRGEGRAARALSALHVRTTAATIRRQVLLAPGDTVDTLRVAESLRRLRRLRFLDDAALLVESCPGRDDVALTVVTHDLWSLQPDVRYSSAQPAPGLAAAGATSSFVGSVGLEERNLLGTGRELRMAVEQRNGQRGTSGVLQDPSLLGLPLAARARVARFAFERSVALSARSWDRDVVSPWRTELALFRSTRGAPNGASGMSLSRAQGVALVGRRLGGLEASAVHAVSLGVEVDGARLAAPSSARLAGPARVDRRFVGAALGAARLATRYETLDWVLPNGAIVDLPRGLEGDVVAAVGRDDGRLDRHSGPSAHLDAWVGRAWRPGARAFVVTDAWASGFLQGGAIDAGTLRLSSTAIGAARGGQWVARLSAELLRDPDPDQRALLGLDLTAPLLSPHQRTARTALAGVAERTLRLTLGSRGPRGAALDLSGFAAGSYRIAPPLRVHGDSAAALGRSAAAALGLGARLVPASATRTSMRVDWLLPVARSAGVRGAPFVRITVLPGFLADRQRDGRRPR